MDYTVEVSTSPISDDAGWEKLRNVLDVVPGSMLIEDRDEPTLIVPVVATEPMKAALFVDGLAKLLDLELKAGQIYPTPEDDFDFDDDAESVESSTTPVVEALTSFVAESPEFEGKLTNDGRLVNC